MLPGTPNSTSTTPIPIISAASATHAAAATAIAALSGDRARNRCPHHSAGPSGLAVSRSAPTDCPADVTAAASVAPAIVLMVLSLREQRGEVVALVRVRE